MKTRKLVLGSVLAASALGLLATGVVNARPYGDCDARFGGRYATLERHGRHPGGPPHHLMKRLDLTEEQRDQMFEIDARPTARDTEEDESAAQRS